LRTVTELERRRRELRRNFRLTPKQVRNMDAAFFEQLDACKSDLARRILIHARPYRIDQSPRKKRADP
jgi:DNA-binding transcriptional regulator/RsmH inhibitor MraZ